MIFTDCHEEKEKRLEERNHDCLRVTLLGPGVRAVLEVLLYVPWCTRRRLGTVLK